MHWKLSDCIPGLYPLGVSSSHPPGWDNPKCLDSAKVNVLGGANPLPHPASLQLNSIEVSIDIYEAQTKGPCLVVFR